MPFIIYGTRFVSNDRICAQLPIQGAARPLRGDNGRAARGDQARAVGDALKGTPVPSLRDTITAAKVTTT